MTNTEIIDRIRQLKKEKNAVILAHYYTRPEVQDIADYLGDSLGLSQEAGKTDARIIVFQFMDGFYFCGNDKLLFVRPACMPDHSCRRVHISLRKI